LNYPTYPDLAGRVVIVTGGASGIGAAFVRAFRANSALVAFLDVDSSAGELLAAAVGAHFRPCDLTDLGALRGAIEAIGHEHGPASVLVNNAANDQRQKFEDVDAVEFDWMNGGEFPPRIFRRTSGAAADAQGRPRLHRQYEFSCLDGWRAVRSYRRPRTAGRR
jgi:NAD(P)-dependent dehydrogenase (short-subunit alcohol dehydrogenase family)